jgi:phospholipase/carboxylesterase
MGGAIVPHAPHASQPVATYGAPLGAGRVVVIAVHGRNAAPKNILDVAPLIGNAQVTFLAPAAAGGSWYPQSFLAPIEQNEPGITSGISVVHALIDDVVAHGVATDRIVLLGFSQGACLATTAAQRRPAHYGGVVAFSGALIGPPGTAWSASGDFDGTPVFLGCSDVDGHIPAERVRESAAHFERMGASVTMRLYPGMGHLVNEEEIVVARDLLATLAAD